MPKKQKYELVNDFLVPEIEIKVKAGTVGVEERNSAPQGYIRLTIPCEPKEIVVPRQFVEPIEQRTQRWRSKRKNRQRWDWIGK